MGSRTYVLFIAVNQKDIILPILDWINGDNGIWQLFEYARDCKSQDVLFELSEKHGNHFYDILKVIDRCNLKSLDFLNLDILEDGKSYSLDRL